MSLSLGYLGISSAQILQNLSTEDLYRESRARGETAISNQEVLVADTRPHTGRAVNDRFVVRNAATETLIDWGEVNKPISEDNYRAIREQYMNYASERELFVQDLVAGADPASSINVRTVTELAWHALFMRNMLEPLRLRPAAEQAAYKPEYHVIDIPSFRIADYKRYGLNSETFILVNFAEREVIIAGSKYGGEMKKSVFGILNYLLPQRGVMSMHSSANVSADGNVAIFFGLSGTGKTTLSTEPGRYLIGDDEHGWNDSGVFNFEHGCYAKTVGLSLETEPEIYATTRRHGSTLENVVMKNGELDYNDTSVTENGRVSYPLSYIPLSLTGDALKSLDPSVFSDRFVRKHPRNIIMLTCDAFGVLPAVSRLSAEDAKREFLTGYTAKVAGTEQGIKEPKATFSHCFGAPFMPLKPSVYGDLLAAKIAKYDVNCWLLNTGWAGGSYGQGKRMSLKLTRSIIARIHDGSLAKEKTRKHRMFCLDVPESIAMPEEAWADGYDMAALKLRDLFEETQHKISQYCKL